ncbi:MAG: complex I NDUFA9 subunit family protein [Gammaproteobacteria bacterium]
MSKPAPLIVLAGGSGFVGRHLAARLTAGGYRIRILTRDSARVRNLRVLPTLEILAHPAIYHPGLIAQAVSGAQILINLVGALHEGRGHDRQFEWTHVGITRNLLAAAAGSGIRHYIQVSALGTDAPQPTSRYLASKARAEALVQSSALDWALVRPSVIYGPDDDFLMRFVELLRFAPGVFPLTCPDSKFAPVDIDDVVKALLTLIDQPSQNRITYRLDGPETWTLRETVNAVANLIQAPRLIVGLPDWISWLMGALLERLPHPPFTLDNYRTLKAQEVLCSYGQVARTHGFEALGIVPHLFLNRASMYLRGSRPVGPGTEGVVAPGTTGLA